jgi:hypothetical protein
LLGFETARHAFAVKAGANLTATAVTQSLKKPLVDSIGVSIN